MNCEAVELELSDAEPSAEAREHLAGCISCQESVRVLGLASLPVPSQTERLVLTGLATSTQRAWNQSQRRFTTIRRVASLVLAAGVGALVASTAVLKLAPTPATRIETRVVTMAPLEVPSFDVSDEPNLSDDEVFFDVGWPSPTEGDQQ
jgi:hypothetical protein